MFGIINDQRDLGKAQAFSLLRTVKDDVFHLGAAQRAGGLLTHDPTDGIRNIGFARPVGADDGGDILAKGQDRLVREGLKSLDFKCF